MKHCLTKYCLYLLLAATGFSCRSEESTLPQKVDLLDAVFASGHIVLENEYLITANTEGYLISPKVSEGDSVSPGKPLFQLSNEVATQQLANAQVNYEDSRQRLLPEAPQQAQLRLQIEQAKNQLVLDEGNLTRYRNLVKSGAVSQLEYDQVKTQYQNSRRQVAILENSLNDLIKQQQLHTQNAASQLNIQRENTRDFSLSSAISGIVLQVYKEPGELVRRGEAIAKIGGGKPLAKLFIAEEDIPRVKVGQTVAIALNTNPEAVSDARISKIYPAFNEQEQSFLAEAQFAEELPLYANTQLQANIIINKKENILAIPRDYLEEGDSVLTAEGKWTAVQVGIRNREWVEVLSGLESGVRIKKQRAE